MRAFAAERRMEGDVGARTGAANGARPPMRRVQRNGDRNRHTRSGRIAPAIPMRRKLSHFSSAFKPRRTAEKALVAVIRKACVHHASTRPVAELVRATGAGGAWRASRSTPPM